MPPKKKKSNDSPSIGLRPDLIGLGPDLTKGVFSFLNLRNHTETREVCKFSKEAGDDNVEYWKKKGGSTYRDFLALWGAVPQLSSSVDGHVEITSNDLVINSQKRLGSYLRTGEPKPQPYHLSEAVQLENVDLVRWLSSIERTKEHQLLPNSKDLYHAIMKKNTELVKCLLDVKQVPEEKDKEGGACKEEASDDSVCWLKPDKTSLRLGVRKEHVDIIKCLLNANNNLKPDQEILRQAANTGNVDLVKFICGSNKNLELNQGVLYAAVCSGNVELVKFICNKNKYLQPNQGLLREAASLGNLELVKLFICDTNNNLQPNQGTLDAAAESGDIDLVKFICDTNNNLQPNKDTLDAAAQSLSDNFLIIKWLCENYPSLTPNKITLDKAAASSNKEVIEGLLENYCLLPDEDTLIHVAESGCIDLIKYLCDYEKAFIDGHGYSGDLRVMPNNKVLTAALHYGHLDIAQWLYRQYKITPALEDMRAATQADLNPTVEWLCDECSLQPTQEILYIATRNNNSYLLEWLCDENRGEKRLQPDEQTREIAYTMGNEDILAVLTRIDQALQQQQDTAPMMV